MLRGNIWSVHIACNMSWCCCGGIFSPRWRMWCFDSSFMCLSFFTCLWKPYKEHYPILIGKESYFILITVLSVSISLAYRIESISDQNVGANNPIWLSSWVLTLAGMNHAPCMAMSHIRYLRIKKAAGAIIHATRTGQHHNNSNKKQHKGPARWTIRQPSDPGKRRHWRRIACVKNGGRHEGHRKFLPEHFVLIICSAICSRL